MTPNSNFRDPSVFGKPWTAYDYLITGFLLILASGAVGYFLWEMWG